MASCFFKLFTVTGAGAQHRERRAERIEPGRELNDNLDKDGMVQNIFLRSARPELRRGVPSTHPLTTPCRTIISNNLLNKKALFIKQALCTLLNKQAYFIKLHFWNVESGIRFV